MVHASEQKRPDIKLQREKWKETIKTLDVSKLVFLDESGVNINLTRRYGRAIGKERVHDYAPLNTPKSTTMLSSICMDGTMIHKEFSGAVNREHFLDYVTNSLTPPYFLVHSVNFYCTRSNTKWLTDVTEFKWYEGSIIHKLYLSAILDLYARRIVVYKIGRSNNNQMVLDTFDEAVAKHPDAHPLFHSDRGFQCTNKTFRNKLDTVGMQQGMSRVGRFIDNGPIEGFWVILKSEMYYLRKFSDEYELIQAIEDYILYYNTRRYQKRLSCMTPFEFYKTI